MTEIMFHRLKTGDAVALTGVTIGVISPFISWLTLKPSRISSGTGIDSLEVLSPLVLSILILLWIVCLVAAYKRGSYIAAVLQGTAANIIFVLGLIIAGQAATRILYDAEPYSRISIGAGIWFHLLATYLVIFAARSRLSAKSMIKHLISWGGIITFTAFLFSGWFNDLSIIQEYSGREERFLQELLHHIYLVGIAVSIGSILGILLGIWASRSRYAEKPIFFISSITQTIPSLALFGLLIAPLSSLSFNFPALRELGIKGVGDTPALIALTIYSLLPIVRNTYAGLKQIDEAAIDAGIGMGMTRIQVFFKIEVFLSLPVVLEGVRTSLVQSVGLATVAALIGAGGLGWFIFQGLGQAAVDLILLGAIPIIILAIFADSIMRLIIRLTTPAGITESNA